MIKFDLICENEHIFEASFDDSKSYESQKKKKLIECPFCMNNLITKSAICIPGFFIVFWDNKKSLLSFISAENDK